jgi:hypothetical protein
MRKRMASAAAGLAGLALAAAPAFGCGHCIEDKVAAVYDHGVITKARDRNHPIAFFAIEGSLPPGRESRRVIAWALAPAKGVDSPSLRVSVDSASLSLSYDGERITSDQIMDTLNRELEARGLIVSLLKVMDNPSGPGAGR